LLYSGLAIRHGGPALGSCGFVFWPFGIATFSQPQTTYLEKGLRRISPFSVLTAALFAGSAALYPMNTSLKLTKSQQVAVVFSSVHSCFFNDS